MHRLLIFGVALSLSGCLLPKGPTQADIHRARVGFFTARTSDEARERMRIWLSVDGRDGSWTPPGARVGSAAELADTGYAVLDREGTPLDVFSRSLPMRSRAPGSFFAYVTTRVPASRWTYQRWSRSGLRVGGVRSTQTYAVVGDWGSFRDLLDSPDVLGVLAIADSLRADPDLGTGTEISWRIHLHDDAHAFYREALDDLGAHRLPGRSFEPVIRIYPGSVPLETLLDQPWVAFVEREGSVIEDLPGVSLPGSESIVESFETYGVRGRDKEALYHAVFEGARAHGMPYGTIGLTEIRWTYSFQPREFSDGFGAISLDVEGTSVITLPRWDRPPRVDPELVALWDQVEQHVLEHELQHQRINEEMLSVFRRSISAIEPQPTVGELAALIEAVRTKIVTDYVSEHALFHRVDRMWEESLELFKDD